MRPLFSPEELEELRRADAEIEAEFRLTEQERRRSYELDQEARGRRKGKRTPEERKEYERQYYLRNKDKIDARSKQWQRDNPEKYKASKRAHYEKNREAVLANAREYQRTHREQYRRLASEYYRKNRDRVIARNKAYYYKKKAMQAQEGETNG